MFPIRITLITINLWNTERWAQRQFAVANFLTTFQPDVLCVQELREPTRDFLDNTLKQHRRVVDQFPGWTCESNIYWNARLLQEVEHGAEDIGIVEEHRRLFWVRLKLKSDNTTFVVCTAHLTYKAHPDELRTGHSPRLEQTHHAVSVLGRLVHSSEAVFFMGDFNDTSHPAFVLNDAGYLDCFTALGIPCPPTTPCLPTGLTSPGTPRPSQTLDWIVSNKHARPVAAQVPQFFFEDSAPSDHWPVLAVYEIASTNP